MTITCCRCRGEYPFKLYDVKTASRPLTICPRCGFQHLVDFLPVAEEERADDVQEIERLDLITYYVDLTASRIADASRSDQSGSDDTDVINWVKADDFILATQVGTSKGPLDRRYKLRWRDVTDAGSFADVAASGEISYTAVTVLVDGATLGSGSKLCTGIPEPDWQDGLESEADNECPDSPGTYSLADDYYSEFQWALDCDGSEYEHEYEFELYEITNGVSIGTCLATLTIKPITYKLEGVTKDKDGNTKGTCECYLCKDNGDNTCTYLAYDQSDGSGNYIFTWIVDNDSAYFVISWKDDSPHVFDVTDHVLQPVEE